MSNSTNEIVQIIAYLSIGLVVIGVGIAFMIRKHQFSFGSILIFTGVFILGFAYYVSQASKLTYDENSPEMNPSAYGTPAYRGNP